MAYSRHFNNTLAIWSAFRGQMITDLPSLTWVRRSSSDFGLPESGTNMMVYANGNSFIAKSYSSSMSRIALYDPLTKTWTQVSSRNGNMQYAGNGVYLWVYNASVYVSFDGRTWSYNGFLSGMGNSVMCGASNGTGGALSAWYVYSPMYETGNIRSSGGWRLAGTWYADGMCCFQEMTCHNGKYVGIASDTIVGSGKGGIQISTDGYRWTRTIQYPIGHASDSSKGFTEIRSVGSKLFLKTYYRVGSSGSSTYQLCVMNAGATSYTVVREGLSADIPNLDALIYVPKLGKFLHFGDSGEMATLS